MCNFFATAELFVKPKAGNWQFSCSDLSKQNWIHFMCL